MLLDIKHWKIEYDRKKTIEGNKLIKSGAETCNCKDCQNYLKHRDTIFPDEFLDILNNLGVDYKKDIEIYSYGYSDDKCFYGYGGWFHANGKILSSKKKSLFSIFLKIFRFKSIKYTALTDNFSIHLENKNDLAAKGFPEPVIQINFSFEVRNLKKTSSMQEYN